VTNWDELNGNYLFSNTAGIEETKIATPKLENLKLKVYPNPFSTSTSIQISCIEHRAEGIELKIYDVSGRVVRNFNLPTAYSILPTNFYWDGTDDFGKKLPVGIYLVVFKNGSESIRGKILMMR
ncbi:T9SS type A sorting domain-containing protein, partial [candidate division WOR-3 bacterium]|nr:T9SS type A sorting domain-containing protein [candidate division WOR-3 bacterium]